MKVYFDTLGCPKNFNDSEMAMGILEEKGYEIAETPEDADVFIVNTCGFIDDAKKESISEIFRMAEQKGKDRKLIVSGCLVQRYSQELFDELPEVDGFLGVNDYDRLPQLLDQMTKPGSERFVVSNPCGLTAIEQEQEHRRLPENPYTAYLKIAEGCDNACAYCVIPRIRGPYRSRRPEAVMEEARRLADAGCRELILIAQDLTYYGTDLRGKPALAELLRSLCRIDGIQWIRLMYCYEDRITDELIQTIAEEEKICNYIDIPIQHASDRILNRMNRHSTEASLRGTIDRLRNAIPDIHIRTTLIVGFPGETDEDFDVLYRFAEDEQFSRLGVFPYSREEGTVAAEMPDQIPEEIKQQRLDSIMMRQMEISLENNRSKLGQVLEVIVDETDEDGSCIGRTRYDAPDIDNSVIFTPLREHCPGDIVNVEILEAFDYDLEGREV
ncbi:30S ribosomal protein S12 methylthiotransferase RimO [Hornefia butyriciproducens]|uniref:30S ribosomal protein S12 methylthiotransferase RimO n=1 Tax=Hornefia butyriciproducens TaxID=2652293 RepID=UPI003F88B1C0